MPRLSTETRTGWYPRADPIGIPDENYAVGNDGPLAAVLHIIDGSLVSCIAEFTAKKRKSAHFGVGRNGSVKQFVSIFDTAFANGLSWNVTRKCWVDPEGNALVIPHAPTWGLLHPPRNPNYYTISIEREGKPADAPTEAMNTAVVELLRWLGQQIPALAPCTALVNLIGHRHIAPIHRANCPGPHVDFAALAARVNGPVLAPAAPTRVIGVAPSVTLAQFQAWLRRYRAPLSAIDAEHVYTFARFLDIDPAFVGAIWQHETSKDGAIGASDLYKKSNNAGAIRAYGRWPSVEHNGAQWNAYESPQLGVMALVFHLKQLYGAAGRYEVETIIPTYAPSGDGNSPTAYIAAVLAAMREMRQ